MNDLRNYLPGERYYPWGPYHYPEAVGGADGAGIDYFNPYYDVIVQAPDSGYTEGRTGGDANVTRQEYGEETLPNYKFFQWVLKTMKKMRKHFIPLYLTGPDISSIYTDFKRARWKKKQRVIITKKICNT